jgi:hypothetical protein
LGIGAFFVKLACIEIHMELVKLLESVTAPALGFFGWARWGICWSNKPIAPRVGDDAAAWGTKAKPLVTHLAGGFAMSRPLSILSA